MAADRMAGGAQRGGYPDIIREFYDALCAAQLSPARALTIQADGRIHRYRVEGDKAGSTNGWYVLYPDGAVPAGAFGSWRTNEQHTWAAQREQEFSPREREEWRRKTEEARQQRERELVKLRQAIAEKAEKLWNLATPAVADGEAAHPYLKAKAIKPYGLRRLKSMLVVPVRNAAGNLTSLQFIGPDGSKRFLTGGEVAGGYSAIGKPEGTLCVCEGFATGASIREATGHAVAVAFNAGNLLPVCKALREKFPAARIIVCADNDQITEGNPGLSRARSAAEQVGGLVVWPEFEPHEQAGSPTDFNDLAALRGLDAVRNAIDTACDNIVPINAARSRKDLETLIDETDDFDELTVRLAAEVNGSGLSPAARDYLLHRIAKKAKCTKSSLRARSASNSHPGSPSGDEITAGADSGGDGLGGLVAELNTRHAVVTVGARVLISAEQVDPDTGRPTTIFLPKKDFELLYANRLVAVGRDDVAGGTAWLRHPERRQLSGVVFSPGRDVPGYLNLWQGWGVEPGPGDVPLFRKFLFDVICGGVGAAFWFLWAWLAHLIQRPRELPGTAIVLRGKQGVGKNTAVEAFGRLIGPHFIELSSMLQLTGRFTGHLADKLLVFANEAIWGGDKSAEGALKAMITDTHAVVERKGQDIVAVRNYKRLIVASNEEWVVPKGKNDRRWAIFDVSDTHRCDRNYFSAIHRELANGGHGALMRALRETDLTGFSPADIPVSLRQAGWELAVRHGNTVERFWFECLVREWITRDPAAAADANEFRWPATVPKDDIKGEYLRWCDRQSIAHREGVETVGKVLAGFGLVSKRLWNGGARMHVYAVPDLDAAREAFGREFNIPPSAWDGGASLADSPD